MFDYDQGLGPGKWLKWFVGAMAVYGISTMWPESKAAILIGAIFAAVGIGLARHQINKRRNPK